MVTAPVNGHSHDKRSTSGYRRLGGATAVQVSLVRSDSITEGQLGLCNHSKFSSYWILKPSLFHYRASFIQQDKGNWPLSTAWKLLLCVLHRLASPRLTRFELIAFTAQFTFSPPCEFLLTADNFRYIPPSNSVPDFSSASLFQSYSCNRATPTPGVFINALDTHCFLLYSEKHPWPHILPSPPAWR